jgi:hypothetical protein
MPAHENSDAGVLPKKEEEKKKAYNIQNTAKV